MCIRDSLYGGTFTLFKNTMPNWGIKVNFVPTHDLEAYENAINENTKAISVSYTHLTVCVDLS